MVLRFTCAGVWCWSSNFEKDPYICVCVFVAGIWAVMLSVSVASLRFFFTATQSAHAFVRCVKLAWPTNLITCGRFGVDTMQVFTFDLRLRTDAISVLMSACKLDREVKKRSDSNFTSGGLYDRLYLCLYHAVARLIKAAATCGKKPKNWLGLFAVKLDRPFLVTVPT